MKENLKTTAAAVSIDSERANERGATLVFTLLVMTLMLGFIALTLSRVASGGEPGGVVSTW